MWRRFAYSLCATPEDAEDAAQEALIILYRKIGTLRASGALASWMFRIVRNECLRQLRSRVHRAEPIPDSAIASAEEEAINRREAERVAAAIAALPGDQRRVLIMRDVQGYGGRMVGSARAEYRGDAITAASGAYVGAGESGVGNDKSIA